MCFTYYLCLEILSMQRTWKLSGKISNNHVHARLSMYDPLLKTLLYSLTCDQKLLLNLSLRQLSASIMFGPFVEI